MANLYCCSDLRWHIEDVFLPGSAPQSCLLIHVEVEFRDLRNHFPFEVWSNDFWIPDLRWLRTTWCLKCLGSLDPGTPQPVNVVQMAPWRWQRSLVAVAPGCFAQARLVVTSGRLVSIPADRLGIPRPSSERPCRHCLGESTLVRFSEMLEAVSLKLKVNQILIGFARLFLPGFCLLHWVWVFAAAGNSAAGNMDLGKWFYAEKTHGKPCRGSLEPFWRVTSWGSWSAGCSWDQEWTWNLERMLQRRRSWLHLW